MKPDAVFCGMVHLEVPQYGVREAGIRRGENAEVDIDGNERGASVPRKVQTKLLGDSVVLVGSGWLVLESLYKMMMQMLIIILAAYLSMYLGS